MNKKNVLIVFIFVITLLTSCMNTNSTVPEDKTYDFNSGAQGWEKGVAGVPTNYESSDYNIEIKQDTTVDNEKVMKLSGVNHNDDMILFVQKKFDKTDNIQPNTTYNIKLGFDVSPSPAETSAFANPQHNIVTELTNMESDLKNEINTSETDMDIKDTTSGAIEEDIKTEENNATPTNINQIIKVGVLNQKPEVVSETRDGREIYALKINEDVSNNSGLISLSQKFDTNDNMNNSIGTNIGNAQSNTTTDSTLTDPNIDLDMKDKQEDFNMLDNDNVDNNTDTNNDNDLGIPDEKSEIDSNNDTTNMDKQNDINLNSNGLTNNNANYIHYEKELEVTTDEKGELYVVIALESYNSGPTQCFIDNVTIGFNQTK